MSSLVASSVTRVSDQALGAAIEATLANRGAPHSVVAVGRRPSAYATSCALEEIRVSLDDGTALDLVFKNLSPRALTDKARRVKPSFILDPRREVEVYRTILVPHELGVGLYAATSDSQTATFWLLTEKVRGREMYQIGEVDSWMAAAQWAAAMHQRLSKTDVTVLGRCAHLCVYDRLFYEQWPERAVRFLGDSGALGARDLSALDWLVDRYDAVIDRLLELPRTIIHGEFCASNVLIAADENGRRVCPVDWEMAAVGPGLIDLASLTLGDWRPDDRRQVIAAYHAAAEDYLGLTLPDALEAVEYCQVHLAVQWLGWFGRRRPPAEHARDWLWEAVVRAERIGL